MRQTPIYLTTDDYSRLRLLAASLASRKKTPNLTRLLEELERAVVMDALAVPQSVVRLGSHVTLLDEDNGETESYTLCTPDRSNVENGMISVLAPIGTAILGYSQGDTIEWQTPGGTRRLKLLRVEQPAAVATHAAVPAWSPLAR